MPDITVIRLLRDKHISAANFTNALNGLVIRAFDISFENPEGTCVGEARFLPDNPSVIARSCRLG